jgi:hypothetical protein
MTINPRFMYQEKKSYVTKICTHHEDNHQFVGKPNPNPSLKFKDPYFTLCLHAFENANMKTLGMHFKVTYHNISTKYMHWKDIPKYSISYRLTSISPMIICTLKFPNIKYCQNKIHTTTRNKRK